MANNAGKIRLEATLQRHIMDYLQQHGAYVFKVVGSPMQQRGTPDLLVCYKGRFLGLEVKLRGEQLKGLQLFEQQRIQQAGGVALRVESLNDVIKALEGIK